MKLTAKVKLLPTTEQGNALKQTILIANKACNHISEQSWQGCLKPAIRNKPHRLICKFPSKLCLVGDSLKRNLLVFAIIFYNIFVRKAWR